MTSGAMRDGAGAARAVRPQAVVIGGSAGATEVLAELLAGLPADFTLPVIVVLHMPRHQPSMLAEVLGPKCACPVREPEDKEPVTPGTVYLASPDYHLLVDAGPVFALSTDAPVNFSLPSIDALFESAAHEYRAALVGIVLTGANDDGARGLRAICDVGGTAVVQSPAEAMARAMPEAAIAACPNARVLTTANIRAYLLSIGTPPPGRADRESK